uniref:Basigin n=1 Tax=Aquila chrysaetos chrysaetos TaxID=223781 RepID=A0A663DXQ8_AQUCH
MLDLVYVKSSSAILNVWGEKGEDLDCCRYVVQCKYWHWNGINCIWRRLLMLIDVCFHGSGVWYLFVDKSVVLNAYQTSFFFDRIEGKVEEHSGIYKCVYKTNLETNPVIKGEISVEVMAYKKSEHGNEGDTGVLTCKNPSFPDVTSWNWYKKGQEPIVNGSGRYIIKSSGNKTELRILKLNIEEDTGDYHCNATNSQGSGGATVNLRVRSRLAALWPFLGIVAEVLVLVTIIFIYEKRRKPDEVLDVLQAGALPSDTPGWKAGVLRVL